MGLMVSLLLAWYVYVFWKGAPFLLPLIPHLVSFCSSPISFLPLSSE